MTCEALTESRFSRCCLIQGRGCLSVLVLHRTVRVDLHRTGCSLFCGADAEENQALLKRVLLAYARWNKAVGYCQGFNMLAALILQVMDRSEADSVKVIEVNMSHPVAYDALL
uniref:(California timema) hypothetical protein n=1 Tax=Timema californicum TaxID=61474 RepID=A0A7R9JFL3_TIMCA|nr:unnamed protein product [Timema californicum]